MKLKIFICLFFYIFVFFGIVKPNENSIGLPFKAGAFIVGLTCSTAFSIVSHEWGHKVVFNYFKSGSAKIEKIRILKGGTRLKDDFFDIENSHLKFAAATIAGPIAGFSSSFSLLQLLAKNNILKSTNSMFLLGLQLGSVFCCYGNLGQLIPIVPHRDGPRAIRALLFKDMSSPSNAKWYHHLCETVLIGMPIGKKLVEWYKKN